MNALYGILNLDADLVNNFALQARLIEKNIENERILQRAARTLKQINDKFQPDNYRPTVSEKNLEELFKKVEADAKQGAATWESRELRIVSYYLARFLKNEVAFRYAIKLIDENWRNIFLGGLIFFILNSWCCAKVELREYVSECLRRHLADYDGGIKKYLAFKEHIDLIETYGPTRLATLLITRDQPVTKAPEFMGLKPATFELQYFSDVIISYISRKPYIEPTDLFEIFGGHKSDRTKKLVFANLIIKAEGSNNGLRQELIARAANSILGDISLQATWAPFDKATNEEIEMLDCAHNLVVTWYARKSVETFFEVCVPDPRRRQFWLQYVDYVTDFRIVGSQTTRGLLQSDGRVSTMLKSCFIETNSRVSTTAALVLSIDNKVFVEFSDVGSVYIYNVDNPIVSNLKRRRRIDGIESLKMTQIGLAVDQQTQKGYYLFYPEGRLTHVGYWETRLSSWFNNIMNLKSGEKRRFETPKSFRNDILPPPIPKSNTATQPPPPPHLSTLDKAKLLPGQRVREQVDGKQSKLIFWNTCKLIANEQGLFLNLAYKDRTYYLCPLQRKDLTGCSVWITKTGIADNFNVVLAQGDRTDTIGTISREVNQILFKPIGRHTVYIQIL